MHKFPEEVPKKDELVIAYIKGGGFILSRYSNALTWSGRKMKFINLMSNGFWRDDVIGWNRVPKTSDTI